MFIEPQAEHIRQNIRAKHLRTLRFQFILIINNTYRQVGMYKVHTDNDIHYMLSNPVRPLTSDNDGEGGGGGEGRRPSVLRTHHHQVLVLLLPVQRCRRRRKVWGGLDVKGRMKSDIVLPR